MEKWINFYSPFFKNHKAVRNFVEVFEKLGPEQPKHPAKIMMHQTQRLVSLSEDLPKIRPHHEPLQLLFLLICAEHIAKLFNNYKNEGRSRVYTRFFFEELVPDKIKSRLINGFSDLDGSPLTVREIVDFLYEVRCDVVHEGKYWDFFFYDGKTPIMNTDPDVIVKMPLSELRSIVVYGCLNAIQTYKGSPNQSVERDCQH